MKPTSLIEVYGEPAMVPVTFFESELLRIQAIPEDKPKIIPKWLLRVLYKHKNLSINQISNLLNCNNETIEKSLHKYQFAIWIEPQSKKVRIPNGYKHSEEIKKRISQANKGRKRPDLAWMNKYDQEFKLKSKQALKHRPNKPEQKMIELIQQNQLPFTYNGITKKEIGRKIPDFIHNTKPILLEVFGRAFHDPNKAFVDNLTYDKTEAGTKEYYQQQGYTCIVIWEEELQQPQIILERIQNKLKETG
jgi:very-short-patch-repair endonuclease